MTLGKVKIGHGFHGIRRLFAVHRVIPLAQFQGLFQAGFYLVEMAVGLVGFGKGRQAFRDKRILHVKNLLSGLYAFSQGFFRSGIILDLSLDHPEMVKQLDENKGVRPSFITLQMV